MRSRRVDGKKLRALRESAWMTQDQLARAAGVTVETISNLENEHRGARSSTVLLIARALGVHPNELLKTKEVG